MDIHCRSSGRGWWVYRPAPRAEGRKQWGVMGTECRNVMRMAAAWSSPMREPDKEKRVQAVQSVGTACYTFLRSLLRHVNGPPDEDSFREDLKAALPEKEAEAIIAAGHRPFRALYLLSRRIEALPLSERQRIEVDKSCVIIGDVCGGTERVYGTPIPLSYTRHTSRFLTVWLFLIPFALYDGFANTWNHTGMIPAAVILAVCLYGIEELSVFLEEPFSILALPGMVQAMKGFSEQLPQWHAMYTEAEYTEQVYGGEEFRNQEAIGGNSKVNDIIGVSDASTFSMASSSEEVNELESLTTNGFYEPNYADEVIEDEPEYWSPTPKPQRSTSYLDSLSP